MEERLGWGREAIKAVGDADFQWRRRASAAKQERSGRRCSGTSSMPRGSSAYFQNNMQGISLVHWIVYSCI